MWDNIIGEHIRRANRNLAVAGLVILALVLLAAVLSLNYYRDFFGGPFALSAGDFQTARALSDFPHTFVTLQADDVAGKVATLTTDNQVTAEYYAYYVGDKYLVAKNTPGAESTALTGVLRAADSDEQREIFDEPDVQDAIRQGALLPVILDTQEDFRGNGYMGLAVGIPLLLIGVWNLARFAWRSADVSRHPSARALARYGDPAQVAMAIGLQAQGPAGQAVLKNIWLTQGWLVRAVPFGIDAVRLEDIVWVYQRVMQARRSLTHTLVIVTRDQKVTEIQAGEKAVDRLGTELAQRVPWVIIGYGSDIEQAWKVNPAGVIRALDERRAQMGHGMPAVMTESMRVPAMPAQ